MTGDKIWPMLRNGQHVVSYRDLRRIHEDDGVALWARCVAEGTTLRGDYVMWSAYSRHWNAWDALAQEVLDK
jgi:hypothetical protein